MISHLSGERLFRDRVIGSGVTGVGGCSTVTAVSQAPLIKLANSHFAARLIDYIELIQ